MYARAREGHNRLAPVSALQSLQSVGCHTVQHFPTQSFVITVTFSLLRLVHCKPSAVPRRKQVFLMTTYCKCSAVLQLRDTSVIHRHIPVKGKPSGTRKKIYADNSPIHRFD